MPQCLYRTVALRKGALDLVLRVTVRSFYMQPSPAPVYCSQQVSARESEWWRREGKREEESAAPPCWINWPDAAAAHVLGLEQAGSRLSFDLSKHLRAPTLSFREARQHKGGVIWMSNKAVNQVMLRAASPCALARERVLMPGFFECCHESSASSAT
jgi:hypothetical protein